MNYQNELLEMILTAETLTLAKTMKLSYKHQTTNDFVSDACREIKERQAEIISLLLDEEDED